MELGTVSCWYNCQVLESWIGAIYNIRSIVLVELFEHGFWYKPSCTSDGIMGLIPFGVDISGYIEEITLLEGQLLRRLRFIR